MKNEILTIFFSLMFLLVGNTVNAQFSSQNEEFICIVEDTITFKLSNEDAFGTFYIGKGIFFRYKDKLCIKQILDINSNVVVVNRKQKLGYTQFLVLESSGKPMKYVSVKIKDANTGKTLIDKNTNENGKLQLNNFEEDKIKGTYVNVILESVGFYAKNELLISPNSYYIFKSQLHYPFTVFNNVNDIKINELNPLYLRLRFNKKVKDLKLVNDKSCKF